MSILTRLASIALLVAFAVDVRAQGTTGVATFNDYTIGGFVPGSSSCTLLPPLTAGGTYLFSVSTAPLVPVTLLFTLSPNCLCQPCFFPFPNQGGCAPPPNGSCTFTNQSLDLVLGCGILTAPLTANAFGIASINVTMPPPGFQFATQAVALHPCAGGSFPFLLSQSYIGRTI